MNRTVRVSALLLAAGWAVLAVSPAQGQESEIKQVQMVNTPTVPPQLRIDLARPLNVPASQLGAATVRAVTRPSGTVLTGAEQQSPPSALLPTMILVQYKAGTVPVGDTLVEVTVTNLKFLTAPIAVATVEGRGLIIVPAGIKALLQRAREAVESVEPPATTDESNVYAAFTMESSKDDTEGTADVVLNLPFNIPALDRGVGGLKLKKGATESGDPQFLDLNVGFQEVIFTPRIRRNLQIIRDEIGQNSNPDNATATNAIESLQSSWFLGYIISGGTHLEADALEFSVTNFTADLAGQLAFPIFRPFGAGSQMSLRLMPVGLEAGRNMGSENDSTQGASIARFKAGASLTLSHRLFDTPGFPRVELSVQSIARHLFENEAQAREGEGPTTIDGWQPWVEAEARLYLIDTEDYRIGFGFSYHNGGLPPTFERARATQFGLIFQSADR